MVIRWYKARFSILGLMVIALFTSCYMPQPQDQISLVDVKQYQGESVTKTLQANNCNGTGELKQDLQAVHQYNHDIVVTPEEAVVVNRRAVVDEIRRYYKIPDGSSDAVCVIPVQIPAGENIAYDIEWIEVWREGTFELGIQDNKPEGTYKFRQSMLCEVVEQRIEPCSSP